MYHTQLNGIRAIAVIGVILHHWVYATNFLGELTHHGTAGVPLFFVLSGFLITGILINIKAEHAINTWRGIKLFYIRRLLRIFPIYYLVILLLFLVVPVAIHQHLPWLITYQYNNEIFFHNWQLPTYIQHLWTLSVEEQFYLLWPIVLLCFSLKHSFRFIIFLIIASIACLGVLYLHDPKSPYALFTLSSFPGLAVGSLLAFLRFKKIRIPYRRLLFVSLILLYVFFHTHYIDFYGKGLLSVISIPTVLLSALIIDKTIDTFSGWIGSLLENKLMDFIGKISYGLYLYHMFIPDLSLYFLHQYAFTWYTMALINSSVLLSLASLSWFMIEKPINNLKNHFNYIPTNPALKK